MDLFLEAKILLITMLIPYFCYQVYLNYHNKKYNTLKEQRDYLMRKLETYKWIKDLKNKPSNYIPKDYEKDILKDTNTNTAEDVNDYIKLVEEELKNILLKLKQYE